MTLACNAARSKTLLHFVAREVAKNAVGGGVALKASLPQCAAAVRLALPATRAELVDLARGLRDSATIASTIPDTEIESAGFRQVLPRPFGALGHRSLGPESLCQVLSKPDLPWWRCRELRT